MCFGDIHRWEGEMRGVRIPRLRDDRGGRDRNRCMQVPRLQTSPKATPGTVGMTEGNGITEKVLSLAVIQRYSEESACGSLGFGMTEGGVASERKEG